METNMWITYRNDGNVKAITIIYLLMKQRF